MRDGDAVALWVIEEALSTSLNNGLRNELGVTYGVHLGVTDTAHGPVLAVSTRVPHDTVGVALRAILDTIAQAAEGELSDAELDRYKLEIARGTVLRWQDPESLLVLLQDAAARGLRPSDLALAERLHRVNSEEIAERFAPCRDHEAITAIGDTDAMETSLDAVGIAWWAYPR